MVIVKSVVTMSIPSEVHIFAILGLGAGVVSLDEEGIFGGTKSCSFFFLLLLLGEDRSKDEDSFVETLEKKE